MERPRPEEPVGRICFRGDSRDPDEIFRDGFTSRSRDKPITYNAANTDTRAIPAAHAAAYAAPSVTVSPRVAYSPAEQRSVEDPTRRIIEYPVPGDVEVDSAVCVTPRFTMATLFPPDVNRADTWVYVAHVQSAYNTHAQQVADGLRAVQREVRARIRLAVTRNEPAEASLARVLEDSALWPLYAQELATKAIDARDVIAAIPCQRAWNGRHWTHGARYTIDSERTRWNRRTRVPKALVRAVRAFLAAEPTTGTTPSRASGFHPSFLTFQDASEFASP